MTERQIETMARAVDFIEDHLTEKLDLERVAEAVHYSKYHLHRMVTATLGLTLHDYVQRRRLTEAAKLLVFSGQEIRDIALLAGYESQQAFTDAFAAFYKQPPKRFREGEEFYPLQLRMDLRGSYAMLGREKPIEQWNILPADEADIPIWMELVRLVIDGFPHLHEEEHVQVLRERIRTGEALILKDGAVAAGILLFSRGTGSIDFLGTHPLYRRRGIHRAFLDRVLRELGAGSAVSITTYRAGDRADTGHRRELQRLGFAEAELLEEFGYPTQRFVLPGELSESGEGEADAR